MSPEKELYLSLARLRCHNDLVAKYGVPMWLFLGIQPLIRSRKHLDVGLRFRASVAEERMVLLPVCLRMR